MKKLCLFFVIVSLSATCFAFGAKDGKMEGKRPQRQGEFRQKSEQCDDQCQKLERRRPRMFENIELTAEQKEKMEAIHKAHRDEVFSLRTDVQKAKIDQRVNLKNQDFSKAKSNAKNINELEGKIEQSRIEMMKKSYDMLTKEQKAKL